MATSLVMANKPLERTAARIPLARRRSLATFAAQGMKTLAQHTATAASAGTIKAIRDERACA